MKIHKSYAAAMGHRLSGLALVLFLPAHFLLLGTALEGAEPLDRALALTDNPLAKFAEWGLVVLLALHLSFGLRVLRLELSAQPDHRADLSRHVTGGLVLALVVGGVFVLRLVG